MNHAAQDLRFLSCELRVDALALGVTDLLEDDLLCRLGGDAAEVLGGRSCSSSSSSSSSASGFRALASSRLISSLGSATSATTLRRA